MRCYKVGGCIRDSMLGLEVKDTDWVVTGSTPEEMAARGFIQVGKDFPVFLHPESKQEYALARTERKQGSGHTGFVVHAEPTVTLEQDLLRRDLTINAMAEDQDGTLVDPFNGSSDLKQGILRHVSPAFAEDPLRVLRVARFAARFSFQVAPETMELMRDISGSGELRTLSAERVWKEWHRALAEPKPTLFFEVLHHCGALDSLMASQLAEPQSLAALNAAAAASEQSLVRFAAHVAAANTGQDRNIRHKELGRRYGISKEYIEAAQVTAKCSSMLLAGSWQASAALATLNHCDAFRRKSRFLQLQAAITAQSANLEGPRQQTLNDRQRLLLLALEAASAIGMDSLPQAQGKGLQGAEIGEALKQMRLDAIYKVFSD